MVAMGMGKRHYVSYHSKSSKKNVTLHQKHESYTFEVTITDKITRKDIATSKRYILRKSAQKLLLLFFYYFILFYFIFFFASYDYFTQSFLLNRSQLKNKSGLALFGICKC